MGLPSAHRLDSSFSRPIHTSFGTDPEVDTRYWPCLHPVPQVFILFIPGNPGLVEYYNDFQSTIYDDNPEAFEIMAVGHVGQSAQFPDTTSTWSTLVRQAQHKIDVVDKIRKIYPKSGGTKLVIINHSMGAYITSQVSRERANSDLLDYGAFC